MAAALPSEILAACAPCLPVSVGEVQFGSVPGKIFETKTKTDTNGLYWFGLVQMWFQTAFF